jgi:coenzyme F420-reducing hydrogenase delta subunit/NAD-dependent dihydropyrimidine dehydrogenase PreA subunit
MALFVKRENESLISHDRPPRWRVSSVGDARSAPGVRAEAVLRRLEALFIRVNSHFSTVFRDDINPFVQVGAVANVAFLVALVSGVLTLFWYSPSVVQAYESVEAMSASPWLAGLIRSLHRYSSDLAMLFALLHGIQTLAQRKTSGARWIAWTSGLVLVGFFWLDGWTGYWLVWDERAQLIARSTAEFLDVIPIFPEPLMRSFLTESSLNSLFFVLIFFIHMLVPLVMGVFLWIHIMRLNRSKFLTGRKLSLIICTVLIVLSVAVPAQSAGKAAMALVPESIPLDWFYMLPVIVMDRLSVSGAWILTSFVTVCLFTVPWWIVRRRTETAVVDEDACNGCAQCFLDCPFEAVSLHPRTEGRGGDVLARIDPAKCVGCGICVGSCNSNGIDQARLPLLDVRRFVNEQANEHFIAFLCGESAGASLKIDGEGRCDDLPGYRIIPVPCAGWVHMLTIERAIRKGARGVLITGCGSDAVCRHGAVWTAERIAGDREPLLRRSEIPAESVRYVRFDRTDTASFLEAARSFASGLEVPQMKRRASLGARVISGTTLLLLLSALTVFGSGSGYSTVTGRSPDLVVSFKLAGENVESVQSDRDDDDVPVHMRRQRVVSRRRVPVRLEIAVDGEIRFSRSYKPGGLFGDGMSIALARIPVNPGPHSVEVSLGRSNEIGTWDYVFRDTLMFIASRHHVVLFNRATGFEVE